MNGSGTWLKFVKFFKTPFSTQKSITTVSCAKSETYSGCGSCVELKGKRGLVWK